MFKRKREKKYQMHESKLLVLSHLKKVKIDITRRRLVNADTWIPLSPDCDKKLRADYCK